MILMLYAQIDFKEMLFQ